MKVLLSAYVCRPGVGSEPGLGWNWVRALSREHQVWVLTASRAQAAIEAVGAPPGVRFIYVHGSGRAPKLFRLSGWLTYYRWQVRAYRRAVALHREVGFDIAHHVTYATWRVPSFLWRLGVPLVWGPIGGGQTIPRGFAPVLGHKGRLQEAVRTVAQALSCGDPFVHACLRYSRAVFAANSPTRELLRRLGRHDVDQLFETAAPEGAGEPPPRPHNGDGPLEILWVGSFVPRKALPLLLQAVAALADRIDVHVTVVGDGPERERWQRAVRRLALTDRVTFTGRLTLGETLAVYRRADLFAFTSIRDTSGNVLLEAMAAGLPIVTLDWAGASDIVGDDCGVKVVPRTIPQTVAELAAAIEQLACDPERRRRMGDLGRERARRHFAWEGLYARIAEVYRAVAAPPAAPRA